MGEQISPRLRYVFGWWVVLTIGLLTPLACILHCVNISEAAPFRIHDGDGLQFFLCDHPLPAAGSPEEMHHDHLLPRPLAEGVMLATSIAPGVLPGRPLMRPALTGTLVSVTLAPPTPPPRVILVQLTRRTLA